VIPGRLFATRRQAHIAVPFLFCDPGATRTPNQQNRNLSFYPLNYGTFQGAKVQRQSHFSKLMPQIDQPEQPGDTFLPKFSYFRGLKETEESSRKHKTLMSMMIAFKKIQSISPSVFLHKYLLKSVH
jgi:hypothetical protein